MPTPRHWPSETRTFKDPRSGIPVRQLTDHKCHSHHLYFTNPGWWDGGRELLFGSDRQGRTNLFSVRLEDGRITQLTDADMPAPPNETSFLFASVNPTRDEAYYWRGPDLIALELRTTVERTLFQCPEGFSQNMTNCTADGRYLCTGIYQKLADSENLLRGYGGFREYFEARPLSRVLRIATDGSGCQVVHEDRNWIGHVNTSPRHANLLTFCWEGPWDRVTQRIWGLDIQTGRTWKVRPQVEGEAVGHEYWLEDGEHVGYHGHGPDGPFFGYCRYDNTDQLERPFPHGSHHFHSNTPDLIVGDGKEKAGMPHVLLWQARGDAFDGPRLLCTHRCSRHIQQLHVHPRFSPDGTQVLFTSDMSGYGQLYLADVPPFDSLPAAE